MNNVNWMQQGWECPKCGAVMSPTTCSCINCRGNKGADHTIHTQSILTNVYTQNDTKNTVEDVYDE